MQATDFSVDLSGIPFPVRYAEAKDGVTVAQVTDLVARHLLTPDDLTRAIPKRTWERRKQRSDTILKLEETDAVIRLLRIRQHALRVFEDAALAAEWLEHPNPALGDECPIMMATTDIGAREVEGVLLRIEHGIFS